MSERIVVCLAVQGPYPADYARLVDLLAKRASAFGATMCASGWEGIAFAFHPDDVEEAVEFARASDAEPLARPFCVGIARGVWRPLMEPTSTIELGFGPALFRARAVASLARPGEVLLDASLNADRRFALSSSEPRSARAPLPIEAHVLAPISDRISDHGRQPIRLLSAELVGRASALDLLSGDPGALATLRAAPGLGGTRVLTACAAAAAPASTLVIAPRGNSVEPLSALRFAFAREAALFRSRPLPDASAAALAALLDGKGVSVEAAATLLEDWLDGPSVGLLLIDDANEVDTSSLEVIATSLLSAAKPFRAVARLDAESPLPAVIALLAPGPEISMGPLSPSDAETVAASWLGGPVADPAVRSLVASADGIPVALRERLLLALAAGDLTAADGAVRSRPGMRAAASDSPLRSSIADRLKSASAGGRAVLWAVALLGGDVSDELAAALVESAADVPIEFVDEVRALIDMGWMEEPEPGWLALPSRSHRRVLLESLPEDRRASWHRAASLTLETHGMGLTCAEAAWHAAAAGDARRSQRLANQASAMATEARLEGAARALTLVATSPARGPSRDDSSPSVAPSDGPSLTIPPTPEQALASRLVARGAGGRSGDSYMPIDVRGASSGPAPASSPATPAIPRAPRPVDAAKLGVGVSPAIKPRSPRPAAPATGRPVPAAIDPASAEALPSKTGGASPVAASPPAGRGSFASLSSVHVVEMAGSLPVIAREAMGSGDEQALERWLSDLADSGKSDRLIERLRSIAALQGKDTGKAIAALRDACAQAKSLNMVEQSRSHLALAVGLARTGRLTDSLLESLEALSRARQAADAHAELACMRFLHRLYDVAGHRTTAFDATPK